MGLMYDNLLMTLMSGTNAPVDYSEPFYYRSPYSADFVSIEKNTSNAPDLTIEVSLDKVNWTTIGTTAVTDEPSNSTIYIRNGSGWVECLNRGTTVFIAQIYDGQKLYIRGTSSNGYITGTDEDYNYFNFGGLHYAEQTEIGGNILSLIYGNNFNGQDTMPFGTRFSALFKQTPPSPSSHYGINYSNKLVLPKNTQQYCYSNMFTNCSGKKFPEILPATTLADYCYEYMFYNCSDLTQAPVLPAITLAKECYLSMFSGCTHLTTAPELPATTLATQCYMLMFRNCTSLTQAPALPSTTLATTCYSGMFNGCTSLTTAPELPATTLTNSCYSGMFQGCTSLTQVPNLPAETLTLGCYQGMFDGCSSLNYVKCLATDISATNCTLIWLRGVSSTGTFVKNENMSSWNTGAGGIPTGWTVQDA